MGGIGALIGALIGSSAGGNDIIILEGLPQEELDIELNAAAGTEMMTLQVSAGTSVGVQDYATVTSAAACNKLDRDDSARDKVNIEVDGSASAVGAVMLTMMFEPANLD